MARLIVVLLFFISGAAGLIYEVTWVRMLTTVFGNTVYATSAVLSAFMSGLALGSYLLGRTSTRIRHPLRIYAILELGIAACAVLMPWGVKLSYVLYTFVYNSISPDPKFLEAVRFVVSCLLLLPPTILMGGTLPILTRVFVRQGKSVSAGVGALYALNTFGAMVGCFASGFVLIAAFGVSGTVYLAVALNTVIGLAAFALSKLHPQLESDLSLADVEAPKSGLAATINGGVPAWFILLAYGVSGLTAMGYEVIWTRLLIFIFGTTTYAFSIMLITFLFGIALGSAVASRLADRLKFPLRTFAELEALVGFAALVAMYLMKYMVSFNEDIISGLQVTTWKGLMVSRFIQAGLIMLPSTIIMGAMFPIIGRVNVKSIHLAGRDIGSIYSANTVGCILGAPLAGFILLPLVGSVHGMLIFIAMNLIVAAVLLVLLAPKQSKKLMLSAYCAVFVVAMFIITPRTLYYDLLNYHQADSKLVYWDEGPSGTVTVHQFSNRLLIASDGIDVAGTAMKLRTTQIFQAHIPLLLHPNPRSILQIGFGTGETSRVVLLHNPDRYDCAEICSGIIKASPFFTSINYGVVKDPRFNLQLNDGKNYVVMTNRTYDVIMNDSIWPFLSGNSSLYTRDHFQAGRDRLNPGGIMSSWIPMDVRKIDIQTIFKTFQDVFPNSFLWMPMNGENKHALLIGFRDDGRIDFKTFREKMQRPEIRPTLELIGATDPYALVSCIQLDPEGMRKYAAGGVINSDDKPFLEFYAARRLSLETDIETWGQIIEDISPYRSDITKHLVNCTEDEKAKLAKYRESSDILIRGIAAGIKWDIEKAIGLYKQALGVNPEDVNARNLPAYEEQRVKTQEKSKVGVTASSVVEGEFNRGLTYWGQGKLNEAAEQFRKVIELDPSDAQAYTNLGAIYGRMGMLQEATKELKTALSIKPGWPDALYNLGLVHMAMKNMDEAEKLFRQLVGDERKRAGEAIEKTRFAPYACERLGLICLERGDVAGAMDEYRKATELSPGYPPPHYNLGLLYEKSGQYAKAQEEFQIVIKLSPDNSNAYLKLGEVYMKLGQPAKALEILQKGTKLTGDPKLTAAAAQLEKKP